MAVEVIVHQTYPYEVLIWPPREFLKRSQMKAWLDANVVWSGELETQVGRNRDNAPVAGNASLHYAIRVATLEDVGIIKLRC